MCLRSVYCWFGLVKSCFKISSFMVKVVTIATPRNHYDYQAKMIPLMSGKDCHKNINSPGIEISSWIFDAEKLYFFRLYFRTVDSFLNSAGMIKCNTLMLWEFANKNSFLAHTHRGSLSHRFNGGEGHILCLLQREIMKFLPVPNEIFFNSASNCWVNISWDRDRFFLKLPSNISTELKTNVLYL